MNAEVFTTIELVTVGVRLVLEYLVILPLSVALPGQPAKYWVSIFPSDQHCYRCASKGFSSRLHILSHSCIKTQFPRKRLDL